MRMRKVKRAHLLVKVEGHLYVIAVSKELSIEGVLVRVSCAEVPYLIMQGGLLYV